MYGLFSGSSILRASSSVVIEPGILKSLLTGTATPGMQIGAYIVRAPTRPRKGEFSPQLPEPMANGTKRRAKALLPVGGLGLRAHAHLLGHDLTEQVDGLDDLHRRQLIEDPLSLTASGYQPALSKDGEMLRDVCLR